MTKKTDTMTTKQIYSLAIKMGVEADFRPKKDVEDADPDAGTEDETSEDEDEETVETDEDEVEDNDDGDDDDDFDSVDIMADDEI